MHDFIWQFCCTCITRIPFRRKHFGCELCECASVITTILTSDFITFTLISLFEILSPIQDSNILETIF